MDAVVDLLAGNRAHADRVHDELGAHQDGQQPDVVTVCCADSRVLQDDMWSLDEPGRAFTCATIGNRVVQRTPAGRTVSGDVLYPVVHAGTRTVLVVGHTGCGAVTATYDELREGVDEPAGIRHCIDMLAPTLEPGLERLPADLRREEAIDHLVEYNVDRQVAALVDSEDVPADVTAVGAVYDLRGSYGGRRGEVHVVTVDGETDPAALREHHPAIADRVERRWTY